MLSKCLSYYENIRYVALGNVNKYLASNTLLKNCNFFFFKIISLQEIKIFNIVRFFLNKLIQLLFIKIFIFNLYATKYSYVV